MTILPSDLTYCMNHEYNQSIVLLDLRKLPEVWILSCLYLFAILSQTLIILIIFMAQGKLKVKTKLPKGVKSGKSEASLKKLAIKPLRKGSKNIKPKKKQHQELNQMKRNMEKLIKKSIEQDTIMKVANTEPRALQILKPS
ncbi:hypothetical protein PHET_05166 [Paragonimus heterotremus]|uniref:Uncharacterized protein n=1 Tax=Paragonimus heterotremus TaxID=100268 RepID=A0A8J4WI19_9TREM|nr:hypothetical protein PHET_05166 [Paragonimus heterotremus]